ncbi:MAG: N-acetylmuramoyl-L-alanine amidase [Ignavibacteriaceae bacterium]
MKRFLQIFVIGLLFCTASFSQSSDELNDAFSYAASTYNIPVDILKAIAYVETRFFHHIPVPEAASCTQMPPSYGIMGLRNNEFFGYSLIRAADLIGKTPQDLINNYRDNIIGAAALLSKIADEKMIGRSDYNNWKPVLEKFSGIPQADVVDFYSFDVMKALKEGAVENGIEIKAHGEVELDFFRKEVNPDNTLSNIQSEDYPPAVWNPSPNFYQTGSFYQKFSVVHDTEGSFSSALSWLISPASSAASHYLIRSSDGYIVQLVREANAAWHAVCWNRWMFGTEHEGFASNPAFFTDTMYINSAALFRHLCDTYTIPMNRNHIIGHGEKSNASWVNYINQNYPSIDPTCNSHTDPGSLWDWNFYMQLITQDTTSPKVTSNFPNTTDSVWASTQIKISFDQRMRKNPAALAFSISPLVTGTFAWENSGKTLVFTPSTLLQLGTQYTISVDTTAINFINNPILGKHTFTFVTRMTSPLSIATAYPQNNQTGISTTVKVRIVFNSPLIQSSLPGNVLMRDTAGANIPLKNPAYREELGKGIVSFGTVNKQGFNQTYKVTLKSRIKNVVGTELGEDYVISFITNPDNYVAGTIVDGFEAIGNWKAPSYSGSTTGIDVAKTTFVISNEEKVSGQFSGKLTVTFANAQGGVCREFNSDKPPVGSIATHKFGMWVFGNLGNNALELWFYYNTSTNAIAPIGSVNWTGWKYIEIPISQIPGSGERLFHSIVIKQSAGGALVDSLYFDGAQKRDPSVSEIKEITEIIPKEYSLEQNYPNPFNPVTTIRYQIPQDGFVSIKIYDILGNEVASLMNEEMKAGYYSTEFNSNSSKLSSGVYFINLKVNGFSQTKKMMLVK